ncbi:IPTL-CTERM sorting domain-containing protein [Comamonas sediminis]|uniref:IPTL-CTERM sorting domain-containing protein n=1 Tax=Comamonas sediminis TaxID=1783360 RepID=UPI003D2792A4
MGRLLTFEDPQNLQTGPVPLGGNLTLAITNTLVKQNTPTATPTPVPSLSQWALALLTLMLGGFAAMRVRRSRMN